jgi:hypothetical protein
MRANHQYMAEWDYGSKQKWAKTMADHNDLVKWNCDLEEF